MKKVFLYLLGFILTIAVVLFIVIELSFHAKMNKKFQIPEFSISDELNKADIELGKRIYSVRSGCIDCHGENLAGKVFIDSAPIGTLAGANITPFNLKNWSDKEIATAIRYGIYKDGRSLRGMPSFDFEGLSKSDMAALIAYIKSVPEVSQASQPLKFGLLAKFLTFIGEMPIAFPAEVIDFKKGFGEKPVEGASLEFGKYLAQTCVGCHGPEFYGGKIKGGDPAWPPASDIRLGKKPIWTEDSFKAMIKTGKSVLNPGQAVRQPMPVLLLAQFNEVEIKALWLYLSSLN